VLGSVLALIAGGIATWDLHNITSVIDDVSTEVNVIASIGSGLYITLVGAALALVGGVYKLPIEESQEETDEQDSRGQLAG
jgi:hypothetical protein